MEKDKNGAAKGVFLQRIKLELKSLQNQIDRVSQQDFEIHKLDIEIILAKVRNLYDHLIELEAEIGKNPIPEEMNEFPPVAIAASEIFETNTKPAEELQIENEMSNPLKPEPVFEPEFEMELQSEPEEEFVVESFSSHIAEETIHLPIAPDIFVKEKPTVEVIIEETRKPEQKPVLSAFDLFTASAEKTISDKFRQEKESTIADKMGHSRISDLRQAIGINEKFLFINELFNGDLGKYNKAIDDLNEMKSREGIDTFFIELKIINQWNEDNAAMTKLKEILDRKFD